MTEAKTWKYSVSLSRDANTTKDQVVVGFHVTANSDEDWNEAISQAEILAAAAKQWANENSANINMVPAKEAPKP